MRPLTLLVPLSLLVGPVAEAEPYPIPPAAQIPGYSASVLPCRVRKPEDRGARRLTNEVVCEHGELEGKSLHELAILRNTIYARYGWAGFRKPWLREHFSAQAWFKANPAFNYKLVSEVDKQNAHLIAAREQSLTSSELWTMRNDVYARRGKVWNDVTRFRLPSGKIQKICTPPKGAQPVDETGTTIEEDEPPGGRSNDCHYKALAWYHADPTYTDARLGADDKIELGLLSRAMGSFALDGGIDHDERGKNDGLDRLLDAKALRQLSMRDLRLLRNTIYARRGRGFKSEVLREHFAGMSWYKLAPDYSDQRLTRTDQRNISLIKSVENEFGGALTDEDWLAEPAIDGA